MDFTNKQAEEIYKRFKGEKIIYSVKDSNFEIKFIKSYIFLIPAFLLLSFLLNLGVLQILSDFEKIIACGVAIGLAILSILFFLSQFYKLYFDNNNLILKNKLNKIIIIDIDKYPRIYIKFHEYESYKPSLGYSVTREKYNLHIEQDNKNIIFNIKIVGSKKIELFLNNIETKEKQNVTEGQWDFSSNEKERTFLDYKSFLSKQEKIVGVKDCFHKMKIDNNSDIKKKLKICTILVIVSFILEYVLNFVFHISEGSFFKDFFLGLGCIFGFFDLFLFTTFIEKGRDNSLKISYPLDGTIKINKYFLNYKKNNIMIDIKITQASAYFEKYSYMLVIKGNNNSYYIDLNLEQEKQLGEFIDNLIFEEKKL